MRSPKVLQPHLLSSQALIESFGEGGVHMVTDEWRYLGTLGKLSLYALLEW